MGEPLSGVILALMTSGIVLGVFVLAWLAIRALLHRTGPLSMRRLGLVFILLGTFEAGFYLGASLFGGRVEWFQFIQAGLFLFAGYLFIREARQPRTRRTQQSRND